MIFSASPLPAGYTDVNKTRIPNDTVTFSFSASSYIPLSFKWYRLLNKAWSEITINNTNTHIINLKDETFLIIKNVSLADYGQYRVVATNDIGSYGQVVQLFGPGILYT